MELTAYRLHLHRVVLFAYHGCLPEENKLGQRFVIDLTAKIALPAPLASDAIDGLVSYAAVFETLKAVFTTETFKTLEAAATAIARSVFDAYPMITCIDLRLDKPSVPVDCVCDSFGISVSFNR